MSVCRDKTPEPSVLATDFASSLSTMASTRPRGPDNWTRYREHSRTPSSHRHPVENEFSRVHIARDTFFKSKRRRWTSRYPLRAQVACLAFAPYVSTVQGHRTFIFKIIRNIFIVRNIIHSFVSLQEFYLKNCVQHFYRPKHILSYHYRIFI